MRFALILALTAAQSLAWAQAGAAAYDPVGIHVDPQGVLRSRSTDPDPRLAELRKGAAALQKDSKFLSVSLPRLFAEVQRLLAAGKALPDEIRFLAGMTKLQYVFVYPEEKDLVIAGPSEPFDPKVAFRPLGRVSGRPVLQLDDLVVAIRSFAGGKKPDRLGCDIEIPKELQEKIANKAKAIGPTAQIVGFRKTCDQIAEAGGPQPVTYYGLDVQTRFAFVCVEADYRFKQLALGLLPSPVAKVESYRSLVLQPEREHRFSLESNYDALRVSPDGNAYELRGLSLKANGGLLGHPESKVDDMSAAGKRFVALCNENFDALVRSMPSWADLCNLGDLAVLGALVSEDRLAERSGWDASWVLEGYPVRKVQAPTSAATLCNFSVIGDRALFLSGGIWIKPSEWASKRASDEKLREKASRPAEGWSSVRR